MKITSDERKQEREENRKDGKEENAEQRMMNKNLIMSVMAKDMTLMKKNFEEQKQM